jgi:hypothetical protein
MVELALFLFFAADIIPPSSEVSYSQPQIASDGKSTGMVFGSKNTIYFSALNGAPVAVAEAPTLSLGNHRGPRLAFTAESIVITAGTGPADQQFAPNTLRSWRSTDYGKTWNPGPDLSTPGSGGMGFQAIASDGKRRIWAAWIGASRGHPTLFFTHSDDEGATWAKQRVLSETVCECCHPSVAIAADGTVHILFRNSVDGNRDFYLDTSKDGEVFQISKLGVGSWAINACPMDGGGLSEWRGQVVTLWRRRNELFLARPGGKAEEPFATGKNAAITLRADGIYAVWQSTEGIMTKAPEKAPRILSATGSYPVIAPAGPVIAAWEDQGRIRTERIDEE